jgi:hypothetical protein
MRPDDEFIAAWAIVLGLVTAIVGAVGAASLIILWSTSV